MKIYNINDVENFLEIIKKCKGSVELVSTQGDRLNLKSELTKYLAISRLFNDNTFINEMELVASEPEDVQMLVNYMTNGN